jgi:DNA (cytosine-5)-methyltransferase 1
VPSLKRGDGKRGGPGLDADGAGAQGLIAHTLRGTGFDASEDGTGRGTPLVVGVPDPAYTLAAGVGARFGSGRDAQDTYAIIHTRTAPTLKAGYVASGARGSRNYGTDADTAESLVTYSIRSDAQREGVARTPSTDADGNVRLRDPGLGITEGLAPTPTLDASAPHAVVIPFDETQITHRENRSRCDPGSPAPALARGARPPTIAFNIYPASGQGADLEASATTHSNALTPTALAASTERGTRIVQSGVRRLTPTECERLMGFPDGYTALPGAADGPRYAALGNSIAVPVLAWIFRRVAAVDALKGGAP